MVVFVSPPGASPLAALTTSAVHSAVHHRQSVEKVVRATLREGTRRGSISTGEERAVVASAVFGTTLLCARLSWMLSHCKREHDAGQAKQSAQAKRLHAARLLLAVFVLHEEPQRVPADAMQRCLPPDSLGLSAATLQRLRRLDAQTISWPSATVPHLATRFSLPCGLARILAEQWPLEEARMAAAAFNMPGPIVLARVPRHEWGCR